MKVIFKIFFFLIFPVIVQASFFSTPQSIVKKCYNRVSKPDFKAELKESPKDINGEYLVNSINYKVEYIGMNWMEREYDITYREEMNLKFNDQGLKTLKNIQETLSQYDFENLTDAQKASFAKCFTGEFLDYDFKNRHQGFLETLATRKGGCMDYSRIYNFIAGSPFLKLMVNKAGGFYVDEGSRIKHSFNVVVIDKKIYYLEPQSKNPIFRELPTFTRKFTEIVITSSDIEAVPAIEDYTNGY